VEIRGKSTGWMVRAAAAVIMKHEQVMISLTYSVFLACPSFFWTASKTCHPIEIPCISGVRRFDCCFLYFSLWFVLNEDITKNSKTLIAFVIVYMLSSHIVKKQGQRTQAVRPMPSWIHPQDSNTDRIKPGGAGTRPKAPPNWRQTNKVQASHMPGTCWHMPSICQPHAACIWLMASIGHQYSSLLGGITGILATTTSSSWPRAHL